MTQAKIILLQTTKGWYVKVKFDDGVEFVSNQVFATRNEARQAFREWADHYGIVTQSVH